MNIAMHAITRKNIASADPILIQAYNANRSFQTELEYYCKLQPDGWFFVMDDQTPIGVGGVVNYGPFAYIGLIAVSPTMQRQGVGKILMEYLLHWLAERNCLSARLVATSSGAMLYSKLGFIQDDVTAAYSLEHPVELPSGITREPVFPLQNDDMGELVAFDTPIFGADRSSVLTSYLANLPGRCFVTRNRDGRITGYIVAQHDALGPWLAQNPAEAEALLVHALSLPFEQAPAIRAHSTHTAAVRLLTQYGFVERRTFKHMYHGTQEPLQLRDQLYALASAALG